MTKKSLMSLVRIPISAMQPHIDGAVRQGIPLETLMARSFIDLRRGDGQDLISPAQRLLLCINTVLTVEDATHGLARHGVRSKFPAIGLMMALGCATLEGAIQVLSRLYASESDAVRIQVKTANEWAVLSVHMETKDDRDLAYLEENFLVWLFIQCLRFLGRPLPVTTVSVRDPNHFNLGRPHWGLRGTVSSGSITGMRFPRQLLAEPPASRYGDDVMWESHRLWLDHLDGKLDLPAPSSFVSGGRFVKFADLVRASGKSPNTLRRRLQARDHGFQDARRRALVQEASFRLTETDDKVETIAADLSYKDAKSFRRFLKNATGLTPQQIREQKRVDHAGADARARQEILALGRKMSV